MASLFRTNGIDKYPPSYRTFECNQHNENFILFNVCVCVCVGDVFFCALTRTQEHIHTLAHDYF